MKPKWSFTVNDWTDAELASAPRRVGYDGSNPKHLKQLAALNVGDVVALKHSDRGKLASAKITRIMGNDFDIQIIAD